MFIVLEGIDGCGKSTQARLLYDWLINTGREVKLTAEPTRENIGNFVREILSSGEEMDPMSLALLFTADRNEHIKNLVEPNLSKGKIVISERYYHSTVAYQSAQGVDRNWIIELNSFARKPDLVIFIDVKPERAVEKIKEKNTRMREELKRHLKILKEEYEHVEQERRKSIAEITSGRNDIHSYTPTQLAQRVDKIYEKFEKKKIDYETERKKYLKLEHFEQPAIFESNDYKYFLGKVYDNYMRFTDMASVDGSQAVDNVFEDIMNLVSRVLR